MSFAAHIPLILAALVLEAAVGYPQFLYRRIGHPVTWIGALIAATETRVNRLDDPAALARLKGCLSLLAWLAVTASICLPFDWLAGRSPVFFLLLVILTASLPAQRSLYGHVKAVATALEDKDISAARHAVALIVGRKTEALDDAGIARAAIESLAENFSDGVVAPCVWIVVGGLTGGALYKTINTADSMIGHRSKRYLFFGWAAARLDDLVNLPAARLSALLLLAAALCDGRIAARQALRAALRDAPRHQSPNAGWPEAAMAGALDLKLGGPRTYDEGFVDGAFMGDGRRAANVQDINSALRLFRRACLIQGALLAAPLALLFLFVTLRG